MFATLLTIALLGITLYLPVVLIERRLVGAAATSTAPDLSLHPRTTSSPSLPASARRLALTLASTRPRRRRGGHGPDAAPARRGADDAHASGSATSRTSSSRRSTSPSTAGYYGEPGLDVTFQNKIDPELITLIGQGAIDIGIGDGTSVIPAVSQAIPVKYVTTIYGAFPTIVFAKADSGITTAADLRASLGFPGRFGSSWVMLQALLASAGLTTDDLTSSTYPDFGQGVAVAAGPGRRCRRLREQRAGPARGRRHPRGPARIDDVAPLPGPGLTVGCATLAAKGEAVRAFRAATLREMEDIMAIQRWASARRPSGCPSSGMMRPRSRPRPRCWKPPWSHGRATTPTRTGWVMSTLPRGSLRSRSWPGSPTASSQTG